MACIDGTAGLLEGKDIFQDELALACKFSFKSSEVEYVCSSSSSSSVKLNVKPTLKRTVWNLETKLSRATVLMCVICQGGRYLF